MYLAKSRMLALLIAGLACLTTTEFAGAQPAHVPDRGRPIQSLGQPQRWKSHLGALGVWDRRGDGSGGAEVFAGVYHDLLNPSMGAFGLVGEGYLRGVDGDGSGGIRLMAWSKFFGLQAGADYSTHDQDVDFLLSATLAGRRGGLLHRGDNIRIDYYPGRDHSLQVGLMIPFRQRSMGKTRPYHDEVTLPRHSLNRESSYEPGVELQQVLERLRHSSDWINRFTTPFFDQDGKTDEKHMEAFVEKMNSFKEHIHLKDELYPQGHTFQEEILQYHEDLVRAFGLTYTAADSISDLDHANTMATMARQILLDQVILPYNRLLGQRKQHDSLQPYGVQAQRFFRTWVETSGNVPPSGRPGALYVFRELLDAMETNRRGSRTIWKDSRLVWIPLHYAVHPDEHDTQAELDGLLQRALATEFSAGNRVNYIINDLFHVELNRMIHAAEDYHVLWIHDYRGRNAAGNPDEVGFRMSVEGYLQALIDKVRNYDQTWKVPVYVIMLDQFFYEANDGRLWMSLLSDPLHHRIDLPEEYATWQQTIEDKQEELRQAVAASKVLQSGIAEHGREWLENQIKVHVNITHPTDLTFRSRHLIGGVFIAPDLLMRDHRKISFYDVTELDPSRGEAIYTGMGVGEHYVGKTWDDRALLVSGPSLLGLKDAARTMLQSQGISPENTPLPLRPLPRPRNYKQRVAALSAAGSHARGLQVHNLPGYGDKRANIVKATLYNLMPAGSHQYIPDSLWNSPLWGGLLIGAALRGCWIFPISPSLENAPSDGIPQMSRASEVFTRLVVIQNQMKQEIRDAGGMLKVGVYNLDVGVGDMVGRSAVMKENFRRHEWMREVIPFHANAWAYVDSFHNELRQEHYHEGYLDHVSEEHRPKLHLKTQFFMSRAVTEHLIPLPEWVPVLRKYIASRIVQVSGLNDYEAEDLLKVAENEVAALAGAWRETTSPENRDKAALFLTLGSHNQDFRGTIMDGEALYVVSGGPAMVAYLDFVTILMTTTWVDSVDELNELIPQHSGFWRWVGRHIRNAL